MKYFKLNDQVFAYSDDQLDLVTEDMIEITGKELDDLLNPPQPEPLLPALTNRQFKLVLLENDLIDDVEKAISEIEDPKLKRRIEIEYEYATSFERYSDSIHIMSDLLELDKEKVDELWLKALDL